MKATSVRKQAEQVQQLEMGQKLSPRTYETCELFFSRIGLCGLDWGDIVQTLSGLRKENTFEDWDDWHARWAATGRRYEERGLKAAAKGYHVTARQWLKQAAGAYHIAEFMYFDNPEAKAHSRQQVTRIFERNIEHLGQPVQRLSIPYEGLSLPGYYLRAPGPGPSPCVVLMNGLDSAKEVELYAFAREFLARGLSAVIFDGPGQGVLAGRYPMAPAFERVFESVLATVLQLDGVDRDRIGLFGVSYGGYLVSRSAAYFQKEVKAVVNLSGGFDHDNYRDVNVMVRKDFRYVFGQPDDDSMARLAIEELHLRSAPSMTAPLLMVHGENDGIIPYESCLRLLDWARGEKELILYPRERHVCTNYFNDFIPRMSDWLATALIARGG